MSYTYGYFLDFVYFVIFSYRSVDRHPVPLNKPKYSHYISYIYKRKICQFINITQDNKWSRNVFLANFNS